MRAQDALRAANEQLQRRGHPPGIRTARELVEDADGYAWLAERLVDLPGDLQAARQALRTAAEELARREDAYQDARDRALVELTGGDVESRKAQARLACAAERDALRVAEMVHRAAVDHLDTLTDARRCAIGLVDLFNAAGKE